jgi:hypothetical protein
MLCTFVDDIIIASSDDKKTEKFIKLLTDKGFAWLYLEFQYTPWLYLIKPPCPKACKWYQLN